MARVCAAPAGSYIKRLLDQRPIGSGFKLISDAYLFIENESVKDKLRCNTLLEITGSYCGGSVNTGTIFNLSGYYVSDGQQTYKLPYTNTWKQSYNKEKEGNVTNHENVVEILSAEQLRQARMPVVAAPPPPVIPNTPDAAPPPQPDPMNMLHAARVASAAKAAAAAAKKGGRRTKHRKQKRRRYTRRRN